MQLREVPKDEQAAAKWAREVEWREAEIQIKRDDLKTKQIEVRDKRLALVLAIVGAAIAAASAIYAARSAATAAQKLETQKWQRGLGDDQRKLIHGDLITLGRELGAGMDHLFSVTSGDSILSKRFDQKEFSAWEMAYRRHVQAINNAALALCLDNAEMATAFRPLHEKWANIGDAVYDVVSKNSRENLGPRLAALNKQLVGIEFMPTMTKALPVIAKPPALTD